MPYTTINKSSLHFNTKLWTGTGSENAITGINFQPDWVWIKERNNTTSHRSFDVLRGATYEVFPDLSDDHSADAQSLKSFDSDGFTLGTDGATNGSSDTYVAWNWKAGDSNTSVSSSGSGNGAINACTHRANTTAGFSIVKYTGRSDELSNGQHTKVTHGLGVKPSFYIIKQLGSKNWVVMLSGYNDKHLHLNTTDASDGGLFTGNTNNSDATHFVVGKDNHVNNEGSDYIAYVFAEKVGYSKFGEYTGNGNDDGPFIYTGFKPAFLLFKETSSGTNDSWFILDNKRNTYNPESKNLRPNNSDAEADSSWMKVDFLSNGFKLRDDDASINESGKNYIYMAFGQSLVGSNNIPCTAR